MQIKLTRPGLDNVLRLIIDNLEAGLRKKSRKEKDQAICLALGSAKAAFQSIIIYEEDEKEDVND